MKFKDVIQKRYFLRSSIIPSLLKAGYRDIALKMYECSDYLKYSLCDYDYTLHYRGSTTCKQRLCPICAKKRSMLYHIKFIPIVRKLIEEKYYINGLNFTIVNTSNLKQSIEVLNKAFRILIHENKDLAKIFKSRFVGGLRCIEVKIGENSKLWHPHMHCIVVKKDYSKDFDWLSKAWNYCVKLAGGKESKTTPGLYGTASIFSIKDKKGLNTDKEKSVEIGVIETIKYITKFEYDMDYELLPELIEATKSVRMINTWGILRNIDLNIEKDMDKDFTEIKQCCCIVCGGTSFIDFSSRRVFNNVKDFDLINAETIRMQKEIPSGFALLRPDLEVGKMYSGVMFTPTLDIMRDTNLYIPIRYTKNKGFFSVLYNNVVIKKEVEFSKHYEKGSFVKYDNMPVPKEIRLSKEMFLEYSATLPDGANELTQDYFNVAKELSQIF